MARAFSQHRARSRGLVIGLGLMLLAESVAIHAFLLDRPWWVHALILTLNASTIAFLWAHDRAIGTRPVEVQEDAIMVRHGLLISARVPLANVASVSAVTWKELEGEPTRGYIKASGFDDPNVLLRLEPEVRVRMGPGVWMSARVIGLRLDDPGGFVTCVHDAWGSAGQGQRFRAGGDSFGAG